jgi:ketosteroid isomerase-like protein
MATRQASPPAEAAAEFVTRFAETWADPSPEGLAALGHPDIVLIQPTMRTMRGRDEVQRGWRELFATMPDLRGEVLGWSSTGDVVYIHLSLRATLARRPFEWTLIDRIRLEDGLVRERISYFDPLPVVLESLKKPSRWPALVRLMLPAQSGRGTRRPAG